MMPSVLFSERAMRLMEAELRLHEREETGGFLLGYVRDTQRLEILEAIDGGFCQVKRTRNSFQYDAEYVQHLSTILCNAYDPPLSLLGMWHKHCHQMEPVFSLADDALHTQLMQMNDGTCVSVLFQQSEIRVEEYRIRVFVINAEMGEQEVSWATA